MASLFSLFGEIFVDNANATKAISKTVDDAASAANKTTDSFGSIAKNIGSGLLAVGAAGVAAAGTLTEIALNAVESGSRVSDMSQALGFSTEGFQEWDYILTQNGASIDSMGASMKNVTNMMADGGAKASESFSKLGLDLETVQGMSQEDAFETLVTQFQGMEDGAEKDALALDIFGKQAQSLSPLLNSTAEETAALKDEAHDLGAVMSDDAIASADTLGDTIDKLKASASGIMASLGTSLMPIIQTIADAIIAYMPQIQAMFEQVAPILADMFENLLPPILDLLMSLLPQILDLIVQIMPFIATLFSELMPIIVQIIEQLMPPILQIVEMILPLLLSLIEPLLPLLSPLLEMLQPFIDLLLMIITPLVDLLNIVLPPIASLLAEFFEWYLPKVTEALSFVVDYLGGAFKDQWDKMNGIISAAIDIFKSIVKYLKENFLADWKAVFQEVGDFFGSIFEGLKNAFKLPINWIIDGINSFIKGLNKLEIPDWVPEVGGMGINLPTIPKLKVGMDYVPSDDFPALLHRGESVLTADEASDYRTGRSGSGNTYAPTVNITISGAEQKTAKELLELISQAVSDQTFGMGGALNYGTL